MDAVIRLNTERLQVSTLDPADAQLVLDYHLRCWPFVAAWSPLVGEDFFTLAAQRSRLEKEQTIRKAGSGVRFFIHLENQLVGDVHLSTIVRGAFQSCFVGYKMDGAATNRGYMSEALRRITIWAFSELRLHRIEANIMPRNIPSRRVVERLGFAEEGLARRYLKINGVWEDHLHYVLLNPDEE